MIDEDLRNFLTKADIGKQMLLTTKELAKVTAGGDDYIRTKNNKVCGLALRSDLNPEAPEIIAFSTGPRIQVRAELFLKAGNAVPTYIKRGTNAWEYIGEYRATAIRRDAATIAQHGKNRDIETIAGILFLESAAEPSVRLIGGGYADAETRREIEEAAIAVAITELERDGYVVQDRQRENCGYDLLAVSESKTLHVEVKGTDSPEPRFFLTRNEWSTAHALSTWQLYVVCESRGMPKLYKFSVNQIEQIFSLDPLAWECRLK